MTTDEVRQLSELLKAQEHLAACIKDLRVQLVGGAPAPWRSFIRSAALNVQRAAGLVTEAAKPFTKKQRAKVMSRRPSPSGSTCAPKGESG